MIKVEIDYEISLVKSQKWNMVLLLKLTCNWNEHFRHWRAVVKTVQNNVYMYWKDTLKYVKELQKQCDKMYLESNKK